jgi:hypothetical protein
MTCKPRKIVGNDPFSAISRDYTRYCDRIVGNGGTIFLEPEVIARAAQIEADGGTVEDILFWDSLVKDGKANGYYSDIVAAYSPSWGVKGTTTASKLYSIIGAAQDIEQTLGSKQPTITTGAQNGKTIITTDGVSQIIKAAFTNNVPVTVVIMALKQITWANGMTIFDGGNAAFRGARQRNVTPQISQRIGATNGALVSDLAVGTAAHARFLLNNPTDNDIQIDNNAEVTDAIAVAGNMDGFSFGGPFPDVAGWANVSGGAFVMLNTTPGTPDYTSKMDAIRTFSKGAYATP